MKGRIIVLLTLWIFSGILESCNSTPDNSGTVSDKTSSSQSVAPANSSGPPEVLKTKNPLPESVRNKLIGKWLRSDGSYTIEVFSVKEDGKMDAGYFNPNPIHVEISEWKIADNILYMRIVLKDINYPGSTYTMMYNVEKDLLTGNYFQAVEGVNYDVEFRRNIEKK